jgi:phage terminase small subunit
MYLNIDELSNGNGGNHSRKSSARRLNPLGTILIALKVLEKS